MCPDHFTDVHFFVCIFSQEHPDCDTLVKEEEAALCILDEKRRSGDERETCQRCQMSIVNVSCVVIIPESEQTTSADEISSTIEEFATAKLSGQLHDSTLLIAYTTAMA